VTQTPGPSITSRPRTNDRHWFTLAGYVALGVGVTVYVIWTVLSADASPFSFRSGLILTGAALFSFFAYLALFRDAVHLSHAEAEWTPNFDSFPRVHRLQRSISLSSRDAGAESNESPVFGSKNGGPSIRNSYLPCASPCCYVSWKAKSATR